MAKDSRKNNVTVSVIWLPEPEDHDCPDAERYLALLTDDVRAAAAMEAMRSLRVTQQLAKDILHASRLPLLARDNPYAESDLAEIAVGVKLAHMPARGPAGAGAG